MLLQLVRALWGGALLAVPRQLLDRMGPPSKGVVVATRLLGARHLIEVIILSRSRSQPRWPVIVDAVHGASMIVVAARSHRLRGDALASAAVAGLLAVWAEGERRTTRPARAITAR